MLNDNFEIYQVKRGDKYFFKRFVDLAKLGGSPDMSDYNLAYSGKLSEFGITAENKDDILNKIYSEFNLNIPNDFTGHSLSVSDVIVLHTDGTATAHYVDDIGFKDVPDFLTEKTREQSHMLSVGDIVTFADRPNVWRVSAINDLQIDFENTDPNSMDKSFSHIDFGQNRDNLQETLKYTLITKDVSSQEKINADNSINSPMGNFETELNNLVAEKNREAVNKIAVGCDISLNGEIYTVKSIDGDFSLTIEPVNKSNADVSAKQYMGNWREKLIEEAGNSPLFVYSEKLVKEMKKIAAKTLTATRNSEKPKKIPNTIPHRNFNKLKKLFPAFMEKNHSYERYESGEFEPLSAEWIGDNMISLMHTYIQNGDLMRDPDIVLKVNFEKETVNAISYENSGMGIYQEYSDGSKGQKDTNSFMVSWLNNIEVQGYELARYDDIDGNRVDIRLLNAEKAAAEKYREKTRSKFNDIDGCNSDTIEKMVSEYISEVLSENEIEAEIGEVILYGSRSRGLENGNSDIDIVVQITSNMKEYALFNVLNEEKYKIGNIDVDINPIRSEETGTLESYLESAEKYLENKGQFALRNDRTYIFSEIIFETGEVYLVPGAITDDNIAETAAYKEILELYADKSNIESLDDMIRVNIQTYSYGSGEEYVLSDKEMDYIRENSMGILNQSEEIGNTEFFAHFWKNVDDILDELDSKAAEQHKTSPSLGDGYEEQTFIYTSDYSSDYPDTNSAVSQLKISGEWLDTEEAVKKMNAQGNTDTAQIEALRVSTVSFDGVVRSEEMSPEAFYIILDRTNKNMDKMRTAAEIYAKNNGNIMPVYTKTSAEATEAGEKEMYFADRRENQKCVSSIDYSISCNNDGMHFNSDKAISDLLNTYSLDRIALIIAARVVDAGEWDRRFSRDNIDWAKSVVKDYPAEKVEAISRLGLKSHSVLLDAAAGELKKNYELFLGMQTEKDSKASEEQSETKTENTSNINNVSDTDNNSQMHDEELTEFDQKTLEIAKKYEKLPLQDKINIIAQAFGGTTGKIVTSPCSGKWRGTSDISIVFDNGANIFIGNRLTPKSKTVKVQTECVNSALVEYNPEIIELAKETALSVLKKREIKDNEIAAQKGLKPYTLLNVEFNDDKTSGYIGWYYVTLAVDGKIRAHMETGLNYDISDGKTSEEQSNRDYYAAGALKDTDVDYIFNNVGFSSKSGLYSLPISDEVRERAEKTLEQLATKKEDVFSDSLEKDTQKESKTAADNSPMGNSASMEYDDQKIREAV
ncbi:MAG: DUF3849 domain-containing protein, partial [Oscillospiraceae bacterium]|nr:DUF3849 domain-containing protein [Oscillospiraceae bacterium]